MYMTKTILKNLLKKHSTRLYPEDQRILPDGFHGRLKFVPDKCILCRLCVIKCPTKIIHIDAEAGLWEREVMGCLYCAVCAEVCPTGCIIMTNIHRPPILEPVVQRFHVTPRPAKKKEQAAQEGEIKVALEAKAVEQALTDDHKAKKEMTEEESAVPVAKAKAEKASAKKKDKK
jgi:ech hydrogenase subunit F